MMELLFAATKMYAIKNMLTFWFGTMVSLRILIFKWQQYFKLFIAGFLIKISQPSNVIRCFEKFYKKLIQIWGWRPAYFLKNSISLGGLGGSVKSMYQYFAISRSITMEGPQLERMGVWNCRHSIFPSFLFC